MNIITAWNLKGGTGKTTTSFNLAATYAAQDKNVLVLDLDMQANLTSFFDADISKHKRSKPDIDQVIRGGIDIRKAIYHSRFDNLDFIKGSNDIMFLELADIYMLGKHLATIADDYDICVIDTHPDASLLTENALAISDLVLIPISLDGFSRDNLNLVIREIIDLESKCGEINFKIFVNKLKNFKSQKIVYGDLVKNHDYPVLETSVSDYSGIQSALLKHKPLFMHRSKSIVNRDYEDLADEVLQIVEVE